MDGVGSGGIAHNLDVHPRTDDVRLKELAPFSKMLLKEAVRKGLAQTGFVYPTVIQATAIPVGKSGLDLLVQSKSGTGKTLIFATIVLEAYRVDVSEPQSLIVAPTREIAVQIESVLNQIGRCASGFRACCVIGGLDVADDRRRLQGARAVVGTPGRLLHLIQNEVLNTAQIRLLVLDEADKMYSASFRQDLQRIQRALPSRRQTIACSATFCDDLDKELARIMRQPLLISTEERATLLLGIKQFAYELPEQKTSILEMQQKLAALRAIFGRIAFKQCVIFAGSQSRADSYRNYLERDGWPCELMSGAQDQRTRLEQFRKFREFRTRILIATDLMSRGIDSDHVNLVINLELPTDVVTYLHRIGRAGRFGSHGIAISFVASEKDRGQLKRLISKVGAGMNVLKFPSLPIKDEACDKKKDNTIEPEKQPERDLWDFSDSFADQRHFGLFGQELIAPLASQDHASSLSQEDNNSSPNKENHTNNICSAAAQQNSSSIDTKTFRVDSKDSALNMLDLLLDRPEEYKQKLTPDSRHSSTQQLPSTSNTIDDASSIAADSLRSSQQDISRYQSVLMQKAAIPTLVEFLIDKNSLTTLSESDVSHNTGAEKKDKNKKKKPTQIDLFEDYEQAVNEGIDFFKQTEDRTDDSPKLTANKLANFKSLLIDKPEQTTLKATTAIDKQKDLYSDYANFNGDGGEEDEASTSISQKTTTEETTAATEGDFDKATFILSVATPSNVHGGQSIEELQNSSLDLSREANDTNSETTSLSEAKHFPSPAHNQPPPVTSSIPDVVPPTSHLIMPSTSHKVKKLTVNVGAQVEIPPYQPQDVTPTDAVFGSVPSVSPISSEAFSNQAAEIEREDYDEDIEDSLLNSADNSAAEDSSVAGGGSSGFDEATTSSASSGIETSEADLVDGSQAYQTSSSENSDDGGDNADIDDDDYDPEYNVDPQELESNEDSEGDYVDDKLYRGEGSADDLLNPYKRWVDMYWQQISLVQSYVELYSSAQQKQQQQLPANGDK